MRFLLTVPVPEEFEIEAEELEKILAESLKLPTKNKSRQRDHAVSARANVRKKRRKNPYRQISHCLKITPKSPHKSPPNYSSEGLEFKFLLAKIWTLNSKKTKISSSPLLFFSLFSLNRFHLFFQRIKTFLRFNSFIGRRKFCDDFAPSCTVVMKKFGA